VRSTIGTALVDEEWFAAFYRVELGRAVRLAHLLTGSNEAAEDIAHDAILRVRDRIADVSNPAGYLTTTVVNLSRNWHRSRGRETARALQVASRAARGGQHEPTDTDVLDVIDRLPFRQRAVLIARYWLDMSEADIAELIGCRPGTVKSLASRALSSVRKELT
jgi:RNA polymerase sigma factor (sigma-70 family)